jgi:hypothetical protein
MSIGPICIRHDEDDLNVGVWIPIY